MYHRLLYLQHTTKTQNLPPWSNNELNIENPNHRLWIIVFRVLTTNPLCSGHFFYEQIYFFSINSYVEKKKYQNNIFKIYSVLESQNDEGLQLPVQTDVFSSVVNACRIKESNMTLKMEQLFYMQNSPLNYNLDGNHPDEICLISSS